MKINTNSNVYIIIYSVVMVVIVAVLLAVASQSLSGTQKENELNEKKSQIVKALMGEAPKGKTYNYDDVVAEAVILNADGEVVSTDVNEVFKSLNKLKETFGNGQYPIFVAKNNCVVIPMYGAGLWGPIWGYIALKEDMNTVNGIVLAHQGETPGLGAEIATEAHQSMYKANKTIYENDELVGITLKKGGATKDAEGNVSAHEVDAITGGTKTSEGVTNMIKECLNYYKPYFDAKRQLMAEASTEVAVEGESNQINTDNNGK